MNASTSSSCAPMGNAASCSMKSSTHARAGRRHPVGPVGRGRYTFPASRRWCAVTSVRRGPGHRDGRRGMIST